MLALAVAHLPFVKMMPSPEPYVVAAGIASYLLLVDLALCIGYRWADVHARIEQLTNEVNWSRGELEQQKASAKDAARLADEKAAKAEQLEQKVSDYEAALEKQAATGHEPACVLSDDEIGRLRALSSRCRKH